MPTVGEPYNPWRIFVGCIIPDAIARRNDLSPTAKLIFGKLCQFAGKKGQAYPSYSTLADEVGVERRQAMRGVKELVEFGLIRPEGQVKENGGYASNLYVFLWHRIFFTDDQADPGGVTKDTRGDVTNITTPKCHPRHHLVSDMTPKENHIRESESEDTTTEQLRLLLSGTPLSKITDKELKILIKRHGSGQVKLAADIAAETWRRDRTEIRNPGGYLQALSESLVVPECYKPPHVRAAESEAAAERKRAQSRKLTEEQEAEERAAQERDDYWHSLTEEDRQIFRDEFRKSSSLYKDLNGRFLDGSAKLLAWERRAEMSTNADSDVEPIR